jgi:hypothetical protein
MGVDYYECHKCGFGFRDDSDYCIYCGCGAHFCSKECADPKYETVYCEKYDKDYEECISCVVCRNQHCTDYALLKFLLDHFSLTKETALQMYFEKNKPEPK